MRTTVLGGDYLDLRDIVDVLEDEDADEDERADAERIAQAFRDDIGGRLDDYAFNEPTAIRDEAFEDYARELAEDIGAVSDDMSWPLTRIDWEAAADDLKIDYNFFEVDGLTYWVRAY